MPFIYRHLMFLSVAMAIPLSFAPMTPSAANALYEPMAAVNSTVNDLPCHTVGYPMNCTPNPICLSIDGPSDCISSVNVHELTAFNDIECATVSDREMHGESGSVQSR